MSDCGTIKTENLKISILLENVKISISSDNLKISIDAKCVYGIQQGFPYTFPYNLS